EDSPDMRSAFDEDLGRSLDHIRDERGARARKGILRRGPPGYPPSEVDVPRAMLRRDHAVLDLVFLENAPKPRQQDMEVAPTELLQRIGRRLLGIPPDPDHRVRQHDAP